MKKYEKIYQPMIGLEIHIELNTKTKMFCSCLNNPNEREPNVNICPVCMGHPGTLPVANKEAIRKVIKTGLVLGSEIPKSSKFDRKNYFYPDLPKGYQISQYEKPLCIGGKLEINNKEIRIRRIHLEEDAGKLIHENDYSLIDFNRAGVPLMELVTEPDMNSAEDVMKFAEELQLILKYLNVSNADMEKGEMRIEVNISVCENKKLGTKVEIKNLNSFRAVNRAIDYEIKRQIKILGEGGKIIHETRGWNENKEITFSQRKKEEAPDYRYFPEPDLPPLYITEEFVSAIMAEIPELPQQKRERFKKEYQISEKEIEFFIQNKSLSEYFEQVISELNEWIKSTKGKSKITDEEFSKLIKICLNYFLTDLQGLIKKQERENKITPENFAEFISLIYEGKISSKIAKMILQEMFETGIDPSQIIEKKELIQINEEVELEKIIKQVLSRNQEVVEKYKSGKTNVFQFLIGQIMAQTKGKANPEILNKILKNELNNCKN